MSNGNHDALKIIFSNLEIPYNDLVKKSHAGLIEFP